MRSQRYAGLGTGVFQQPGPKAVLEEAVGGALVDEEFREAASIRDYRGRRAATLTRPFRDTFEDWSRPAGSAWLDDRRKCRAASEAPWIFQGNR